MGAKVYRFYAAALSGLEEVAVDELKGSLAEVSSLRIERGNRQGRVFFTHRRSPRQLLDLHTPLSICGLLAQVQGVTVGRPGLERLLEQLRKVDFTAAQGLLKACEPEANDRQFQLSVTLQGAHRFSKSELVRQFQAQLQGRGFQPGQGRSLLRLQLQVEGARALLGVQLGPNRADQCLEQGGIGGPLASCLGRLLPATGGEVLLALGCSQAGVEELVATGERGPLIALAPRAAKGAGRNIWPVQGQPETLPLAAGCADLVLAAGLGPPFHPWLAELSRVLHPGGVVALLAGESRPLAAVLAVWEEFSIVAGLPIILKGRRHTLWMLERLGGPEPLLEIEGVGLGG